MHINSIDWFSGLQNTIIGDTIKHYQLFLYLRHDRRSKKLTGIRKAKRQCHDLDKNTQLAETTSKSKYKPIRYDEELWWKATWFRDSSYYMCYLWT